MAGSKRSDDKNASASAQPMRNLGKLEEAENVGNNRKLTEAEKANAGCSMYAARQAANPKTRKL